MDLKYLKGVGEERAKILAKELEINSIRDLLDFFPYRHVDKSKI